VLGFWFGPPPLQARAEWFRKDTAFDAAVRERFGSTLEAGLAGTLPASWEREPLAEILLLDQLTRNAFRGTPRAFAGDARALALARAMVAAGTDAALHPIQRCFVLLPFEHAEDAAAQDEAVRRFDAIAGADPFCAHAADFARRHRDVIRRFGRFPHRNAVLGRASTPQELAYLAEPGSGF
jgi:uncharacterized protein (DUF924 family)